MTRSIHFELGWPFSHCAVRTVYQRLVSTSRERRRRRRSKHREPHRRRVTCSLLDGNQVNASRTYTHSRLISCTRDSSVVLERLAPSIWSLSVYTPFMGNPRVYPLCDPGPALSENLTSTFLSQNSGISHLTRNEVSLKGRQLSDHRDVSP